MNDEMKWKSGPPPHVGWWNASASEDASLWRWWNGKRWSWGATNTLTPLQASRVAMMKASAPGIRWRSYYPADARVPRIAP